MGRTGRWFGYQHYEVVPDIITLAKTLGGGVAIGAIVAKPEIASVLVPGTHASTFGGNPLACAAAIATIEAIEGDKLIDNAVRMGQYAIAKLSALKQQFPIIRELRGKGLMIGIELTVPGSNIVSKCLEQGLRINCTQGNILRFMPSMTISTEEIDQAIGILSNVLETEG
jgi:acetylornithine/succinyldiaminopimelate/putrescine aminotransferase